jgi:hypothetical protein
VQASYDETAMVGAHGDDEAFSAPRADFRREIAINSPVSLGIKLGDWFEARSCNRFAEYRIVIIV